MRRRLGSLVLIAGVMLAGSALRFVTATDFEVSTCSYDLRETQRDPAHRMRRIGAERPRRARSPL